MIIDIVEPHICMFPECSAYRARCCQNRSCTSPCENCIGPEMIPKLDLK